MKSKNELISLKLAVCNKCRTKALPGRQKPSWTKMTRLKKALP
jgi:hypothetical protein